MSDMNFMPDNKELSKILKNNGFKVFKDSFETQVLYSVDSWESRFSLTDDQYEKLTKLYYKYYSIHPELFIEKDTKLYINAYIYVVYALKEKCSK